MSQSRTYAALKEMLKGGLIEEVGWQESGKQDKPRMTYRISPEGRLRSVEAGERAGLFFDELPSDIQRLLNQLR